MCCLTAGLPRRRKLPLLRKATQLDVLAMLKKSSNVLYEYQGKQLDIKKIYAMNRKRPGCSKYFLSVEVNLLQKEKGQVISSIPVRIVLVRNRANRKDWIALISTDLDISEKEIIRRYGVRWNIEVYFKTCNQYLKLLKECNSTSFDALTCHLAIVCVRYMILSVCRGHQPMIESFRNCSVSSLPRRRKSASQRPLHCFSMHCSIQCVSSSLSLMSKWRHLLRDS